MEHLNKHQIILLAILVAFVSSIATGITTVSLLGQSPQPVAQTINRVVEKTIERVVSQDSGSKEKTTVVVRDEDLTIGAIEKNSKSLVFIKGVLPDGTETFISDGLVVSDKGYLVSEKAFLAQMNSYIGVFSDGTKVPLEIVASNDALGVSLLKAKPAQGQNVVFHPVAWADSSTVKLGQSVISLAGETKNTVNIGNVVSLDSKDNKVNAIVASGQILNSLAGSLLLNLSGEVVGVHIGVDKQVFISSNVLKEAVNQLIPKQ